MNRYRSSLRVGTGFGFVSALMLTAGCPNSMNGNGNNNGEGDFTATLTGAAEVPSVTTGASGTATFDLSGNDLTFDITAEGFDSTVMAAHFHNAPFGVNGEVVFDLTNLIMETEPGAISIQGTWMMSAADLEALMAEELYVNIHTADEPDGEIRGQVREN